MGRLVTIDEYLTRLSERVVDNSRQLKRGVHQRRNGMEDLYGVCFTSNGDATHPASFYVSLSPDYIYLERFALKLVIKPFTSSVAGASGGSISIGATELTFDSVVDPTTGEVTTSATPNPHTHSVSGGGGSVDYGVKKVDTTSTNWRLSIDGIDITPYLIAQHDGEWIRGQNVYPNNNVGGAKAFYDILEVCDVLTDEQKIDERDQILASGFKRVDLASDAPFGVDFYLYLKYNHLNK